MAIYRHIRRVTQRCFALFLGLCPQQSRLLQFYDPSRPNALLVTAPSLKPRRIFMLGATGTIGRARWRCDQSGIACTRRIQGRALRCRGVVHGVTQMVLLSAICVQKPLLAFQHAKLAFKKQLIRSGLTYSIARTGRILSRVTLGNHSMNVWVGTSSSRFSKSAATGPRVPRNSHAPLYRSGSLSTAGQDDQSMRRFPAHATPLYLS